MRSNKDDLKVKQRRPSRSNKDDLQGQTKTTFKVKRRRPSRPNEDDLQGQTKTTLEAKRRRPSGPIEDDLRRADWEDDFLALVSQKDDLRQSGRRPSTQAFGFRCSSTPDPRSRSGLGSVPQKQHPRPRHFPNNGTERPAPSPKHDDRYSIGPRSHLFGVVSGQPLGACHQLKRHRSHCRSTSFVHSENKPVPSQL